MTLESPSFVALDRDGTLLEYVPYLTEVADIRLRQSAGQAVALLNRATVRVLLVTNQSVVGRGLLDEVGLRAIHLRVVDLLAAHGARLDEILYCPHAPEDECECRKPRPGLLARYLDRECLEPCNGYVVGDSVTDLEFADNVGAKSIHVQGGVNSKFEVRERYPDSPSVSDLGEAVAVILGLQK